MGLAAISSVDTNLSAVRVPMNDMAGEVLHIKAGQKLFDEGTEPTGFYWLKEGAIKLTVNRKLMRGRAATPEYLLKVVAPGEFFGFKGLLRGTKHSFTATAASDSIVVYHARQPNTMINIQGESVYQDVLKQALKDLETFETNSQLNYLASVQERISYQIYMLAKKFGRQTPDGILIGVRLSRNELAQLAGTINESLSRHLTDLKNSEVLILRGRELIVKNMPELIFRAGNFIG